MPDLSYQEPEAVPGTGSTVLPAQVAELQRDLRRLGYLSRGIDGCFGPETTRAVMALQHDLLHNSGGGSRGAGEAPVRVTGYNRGRVRAVTGVLDRGTSECMAEMLRDPAFPKLPSADDPAAENQRILVHLQQLPPGEVPPPFLLAVLKEESGLRHFAVPRGADRDNFIVVGMHTREDAPHVIVGRGYGAGQHTLFHHPPRQEEVTELMLDAARNVAHAATTLREKLESYVNGPAARAEDRIAERGAGPVVACKYPAADPRFMRDCRNCVAAAGFRSLRSGLPLFAGSPEVWRPTPQHPTVVHGGVPVRERIGCDWPYAVRRYHGEGLDSYHFRARVLKHLAML